LCSVYDRRADKRGLSCLHSPQRGVLLHQQSTRMNLGSTWAQTSRKRSEAGSCTSGEDTCLQGIVFPAHWQPGLPLPARRTGERRREEPVRPGIHARDDDDEMCKPALYRFRQGGKQRASQGDPRCTRMLVRMAPVVLASSIRFAPWGLSPTGCARLSICQSGAKSHINIAPSP
jgi:hypothetical protein